MSYLWAERLRMAGAELPCLPGTIAARFVRPKLTWNREPRTLRVVEGTQAARPKYHKRCVAAIWMGRMGIWRRGAGTIAAACLSGTGLARRGGLAVFVFDH